MPAEISLAAEANRPRGSRHSRRLRAAGRIPAIVYGHGIEPLAVAVDARELRAVLTTEAGFNALLNLSVDSGSHLTLARDIQRDPVRGTVIHVDFQIVRRDEIVSAEVPVVLVGEAEEVHRGDGVVEQQLFSLVVHATPARIPTSIDVDISGLAIGDTVRVGDLALPDGATTDIDPEQAVVVAQARQAEEIEQPAEGAEAEAGSGPGEGAAGAGAAGEG